MHDDHSHYDQHYREDKNDRSSDICHACCRNIHRVAVDTIDLGIARESIPDLQIEFVKISAFFGLEQHNCKGIRRIKLCFHLIENLVVYERIITCYVH